MKGDLRKCTKCGEEKPATTEFFYRNKRAKSGLNTECKDCAKVRQKAWRKENPEKNKAWFEANPEKRAALNEKWRKANPEKVAASSKKYREKNPEKLRAALYSWRKKNPEKCKARRASDYKYRKKRRKEDPVYRLNCYMRSGLSNCLSGKQKNSHTFDYIGLTPEELMDYFEGQFTEGMTRENYGEWHVDHIRPLASFDFTGPDREEQLHAAWSYKNMQPLWASDNRSKGARYEEGSLL